VAAELRARGEAEIDMKPGGLGELRVTVDGRDVYVGNRLWYATPAKILRSVDAVTGRRPPG
jgi:hypothetical protein